jgi:O-antigen/teichoic acid export membrane protein
MALGMSLKGDGLRSRSIRSSLLTGLSFGASNLLRLGGNLILTRILFPEAFGIMALVQVMMSGLNMFSDIGIRVSIIQNERGEDPAFLDTAWVMQVGRGFVLWLITWVLAAPFAAFYGLPILADLIPVAGLIALIQGLNSTKLVLANRALTLGRVTMIEIGSSVLGLAVLIVLALMWESVWALVIGSLFAPFMVMVLSHVALPGHSNRLRFEAKAGRTLVNFGKFIFLSTLAGFLISHADRALLGKFASLSDLALYNIAFMFASIPVMIMRRINAAVLFPLYSRIPPAESGENYRNIAHARWMMMVTIMALLGFLAIFGNQLIIMLYDPRYETAGVLVAWIAIASTPHVVTGSYGSMMLAAGDSRRFAIFLILSAGLRTVALLIGVYNYGLIGAALAPLVADILFYPATVWFLRPYGGWIPRQDVIFSLIACAIAAVAIWVNYDALKMSLEIFGASTLSAGSSS